tara:strand:- start:125 stop:868 length:744 start_codon:yes stop_codon:yes gene_type:complete
MDKIRVSAVSYLNSIPFVYGLEKSSVQSQIELSLDIPSECANKLLDNQIDLGLVPVAIIPQLKFFEIISPYCIGSNGPVETVCLFSEVPLNEIEEIQLDFHSKTSVQLVQLLSKKYWNISPKFNHAKEGFENDLSDKQAGVIIGDRAYQYRGKFKYVYDLPEEWRKYTGLPFVFACWIANKPLSDSFKKSFVEALHFGVKRLDLSLEEIGMNFPSSINQKRYLTEVISYDFDTEKKQALARFLQEIS